MDVVYINRPGEENEELRYSLRSLRNIPHDRVWIAGYKPTWAITEAIPVERMRDKQTSALDNLIAALNHPDVSDPFLVFNDDFFVMHPLDGMPTLHLGDLDKVIAEHRPGASYRNAMQKTRDRLAENVEGPLFSYETHAPMVIEKLGMQLALSIGQGIHGLHNRTMYGNLMELGGTETHDFKIYRAEKRDEYKEWDFLSTSDRTFHYHHAGRFIRESFRDSSPYEKPQPRTRRNRAIRYHSVVINP